MINYSSKTVLEVDSEHPAWRDNYNREILIDKFNRENLMYKCNRENIIDKWNRIKKIMCKWKEREAK